MKLFQKGYSFSPLLILLSLLFGFALLSNPVPVSAKKTINEAAGILKQDVIPQTGMSTKDLSTHAGSIIQASLRLIGIAFLVLMVYGGLRWMTARGNDTEIETAKETIAAAIIGLIIVVGAYAITNFVTKRFIQGQTGSGDGIPGAPEQPQAGPEGCCEFKINEVPTWTAFMMTENACKASCVNSLGKDNCGTDDYIWTSDLSAGECEVRRQDALR